MRNHYYSELRGFAPLSLLEESALIERLRTNPSAEDRALLITSNLRFVAAIARQYRGRGVPLEDLINEGNIGLIEAVPRYEPGRGTRFISYAIWWIRKAILRAIADRSLIRIPAYRQKQIRGARDREESLVWLKTSGSKRTGLEDELSEALRSLDDLREATPRDYLILDVLGGRNDRPVDDLLADEGAVSAETLMLQDESEGIVADALGILTPLEKKVILGRFGLEDGRPRILKELAAELGLSRERVRQIEHKARAKIRKSINRRRRGP